jgi:hypothetical protein
MKTPTPTKRARSAAPKAAKKAATKVAPKPMRKPTPKPTPKPAAKSAPKPAIKAAAKTAPRKAAAAPAASRTAGKVVKATKAAPARVPAAPAKARAVAKAKAVAPGVPARLGSTPATKFRGNPDIFGRLVEDHDRHRALLAMLFETQGKSPDRQRIFRELVRDIKAHAAAEEQALWSSVMRNPKTTDEARHAVGEHKEMDKMLADMAARDMASSGWLRRFEAVREEYLHHIREEEQEQFKAAEKHLTPADLRHMRQVFNLRKAAEKSTAKVEKKIRLKA